jgi:hypothetical protein
VYIINPPKSTKSRIAQIALFFLRAKYLHVVMSHDPESPGTCQA